ncbi:hypothetical protein [Flavobacterium pectinovorum]|uniref:Uncharacterized protein n=1 Tax=Flavobacterium pectinovorum TaxID=29533 RepID=A0AB36NU76_9FLAO|nr:hypothetical protein [Flavobacterium pectinovorum]OXA99217.1 hypothetical protein B0A72_22525 [Flavobacterium pectinovorum]SHN21705.1 hypothetical protein SAMN05444387_4738 [Flavobacterium pectinovorum]
MFITLTHDQVRFYYGSEHWQYNFDEIVELGLLKKKKSYFLENIVFLIVTAFAYYFIIFSNFAELYYIIPTLLCYTILIILRFPKNIEFDYYVIVKDIYQKETKIKIKALDRTKIGKQIDQYLSLKFDQILQEA